MKVNVQEAKAQLSRLLDAALAGEDVVIAVADRKPGAAAGRAHAGHADG